MGIHAGKGMLCLYGLSLLFMTKKSACLIGQDRRFPLLFLFHRIKHRFLNHEIGQGQNDRRQKSHAKA